MSPFVVLLLAIASRIIPHTVFHEVSWNFTMLGGALLFFGSRMAGSPRVAAAKVGAAMIALIATDYYLTVYAYGYAFHASAYLVTWVWYAAVCLLGMGLLQKASVPRVAAGAIAAPTSFFLLSNFAVWVGSTMYPHTASGLGACYVAGLPFYRNDVVSTAITAGALFGVPALASRIADSFRTAHNNNLAV
jgi:hypothetical protein